MQLNADYEAQLRWKQGEHYSIEWLARTLYTSVSFDTPPKPSGVSTYPVSSGLMFACQTMIDEEAGPALVKFVTYNNDLACRQSAYKILRTLRKHGYEPRL